MFHKGCPELLKYIFLTNKCTKLKYLILISERALLKKWQKRKKELLIFRCLKPLGNMLFNHFIYHFTCIYGALRDTLECSSAPDCKHHVSPWTGQSQVRRGVHLNTLLFIPFGLIMCLLLAFFPLPHNPATTYYCNIGKNIVLMD